MDYGVRKAELKDLEYLVELWRKLSIDQLSKDEYYMGDLEFRNGQNQMRTSILSDKCGIFVLERDNKIGGFIEAWIDSSYYLVESEEAAYVLHCYIDEDCRGYICAKLLFDCIQEWALLKGKKYIVSDAFEHNRRVMALLQYNGAQIYKSRLVREI